MRMSRPFQIGQMGRHRRIVRIRQSISIPLVLPPMEVVMHLPHIVKQIANTDTIRLIAKLIFIGFHGLSSLKPLTPFQWVADTEPCDSAETVCQLDISIKPHLTKNVKCFFQKMLWSFSRGRCLHPTS